MNSLTLVLLLFQYEHVVIEELLEFLVDKVDPQLFETVVLKECVQIYHLRYHAYVYLLFKFAYVEDLESGDVQHTDEIIFADGLVAGQCGVTFVDQKVEQTIVDTLAHGTNTPQDLFSSLTLGHPLSTDFDARLSDGLQVLFSVETEHGGTLLGLCRCGDSAKWK